MFSETQKSGHQVSTRQGGTRSWDTPIRRDWTETWKYRMTTDHGHGSDVKTHQLGWGRCGQGGARLTPDKSKKVNTQKQGRARDAKSVQRRAKETELRF